MKTKRKLLLIILCGFILPPSLSYGQIGNVPYGLGALVSATASSNYNSAFGWYPLAALTSGNYNTAIGSAALFSNNADANTAVGYQALYLNTAANNTAVGYQALGGNISGVNNCAIGFATLLYNTASYNSAFGTQALGLNTSGSINDAFGYGALYSNLTGDSDAAFGYYALYTNQTGISCSAFGNGALFNNTVSYNDAFGYRALYHNTTGYGNIGIGYQALCHNTAGLSSTAVGYEALFSNQTYSDEGELNQSDMTAVGYKAGYYTDNAEEDSYFGFEAGYDNTTGSNNTYLGCESAQHNTDGVENTVVGEEADLNDDGGNYNTVMGRQAAKHVTDADDNTIIGYQALLSDQVGALNTMVGAHSGNSTDNEQNTFIGFYAGFTNSSSPSTHEGGLENTCLGSESDIAQQGLSNATAIGWHSFVYTNNTIVLGSAGTFGGTAVTQLDFNGALSPSIGSDSYNAGLSGNIFLSQGLGNNDTWLANGASGYVLQSNGTGVAPSWVDPTSVSTGLTATYVGYGSASNTLTGDADFTRFKVGSFGAGGITLGDFFNNTYINTGLANSGTIGNNNTALGYNSMYNVGIGSDNAAVGWGTLYYDEYASHNTAMGYQALYSQDYSTSLIDIYSADNVAIGYQALYANNPSLTSNGIQNTALGDYAGSANITGYGNVFVGYGAGTDFAGGYNNTFVGYNATTTTDGWNDCAAIGYDAICNINNTMMFGDAYISALSTYANNLFEGSDGRFKRNVASNVVGLDFINKLKPITYNWDAEALNDHIHGTKINILPAQQEAKDAKDKIVCSGFIAQDVETAAKSVGYNFSGVHTPENDKDIYMLDYGEFVVPLTKAVQELSVKSDSKDSIIAQQQQQIIAQAQQLQNQQSQLDQLSAMVSKLDIALSQCCTNYNSTTTGSSQIDSDNNNVPLLNQNMPNPFSQKSVISCYVPTTAKGASIIIYNLEGAILKSYTIPTTGFNQITITGGTLAAGDYLYTLFVDGAKIDTKKMTLTH